jgi:hypothetical protein
MTTAQKSRRSNCIFALALLLLVAGASTSAHRRDEYLEAARLAIDPDRVQIEVDLTPGIAVAQRVTAEMDVDGNQSIGPAEARAYSERLLSRIALDVDGAALDLELVDTAFPEVDAVLKGEGTARVRAVARLSRLSAGVHRLRYRNTHNPEIAVYLANVLVPDDDRVVVAAQRRDVDQRELVVEYTLRADPGTEMLQSFALSLAGISILVACLWWRSRSPVEL